GKAVEQVAVGAIGLLQAIADQADDDLIRNQAAGFHDLLGLQAKGGAGLDGGAQHVAGRDLRNAEALADERRLRSLSGARGAQQNQSHEEFRPEWGPRLSPMRRTVNFGGRPRMPP